MVTGAARGIGRALANGLAKEGAAVACLDVDVEGARTTADGITRSSGNALALECDVTHWRSVEQSLALALEALGTVDILAANAGGPRGEAVSFLELDPATWHRMVDRNLTGAFHCGLAYGRHMAAQGRGSIVFTSSQLSEVVRPGLAHYCAAKGGVRQLVRAMAVELAPMGVRVNAIAPGPTSTPGTRALFQRPDVLEANRRSIPLGRVAEPEEMVGAAVYLASDEASFTTGTTVFVDGGYTIV